MTHHRPRCDISPGRNGAFPMTIDQFKAKPAGATALLALGGWSLLYRIGRTFSTWRARSRMRFAARQLSDHALKDIGLSRADLYREYSKPFWRD